jgi:hypothetical protein
MDLGVFGAIEERVSHGVEKAMTKGMVSMRGSMRCPWAAWHDMCVGGGDVRCGKDGGSCTSPSHCWRYEVHARVLAGGIGSISEAATNSGFLTKI